MEEYSKGFSQIDEEGHVNITGNMSECVLPVLAGEERAFEEPVPDTMMSSPSEESVPNTLMSPTNTKGPSGECVPNTLMSPMMTIGPSVECVPNTLMSPMKTIGPSVECAPNTMMSPMKTIETVETIVSTNKVAVYTTIESPKVGMVFKNMLEVESYNKQYAEQQGFGVTRSQGYTSKKSKERRGTTWRCECWGHPDSRARRAANKRAKSTDVSGTCSVDGVIGEDELSRGKRTSKKCECGAMIYASVNEDGLWVLRKVFLEHVHKVSPSKSKLVKEYRMKKLTTNVRRTLLHFYEEGVTVNQIHGCLGLDKKEEIGPTVKDLQHEVYKEQRARLNMAGGDCAAMMEYFEKMQSDNSNFYHTHRRDDDGRMKDVMWVDARSRAAFEYFGDVVCMDATYLTNEYELPFINVVGVNHHGQSILLGCALVSHEDTETYSWFIRQWLACMNDNPPNAILTDQAAAIRKALSLEMPTARYRWCIWHIMRKIPEKLGKCDGYLDFKSPLKKVIYESFSKEEFETRWANLIIEHNLVENDWLSDLYEERHMWVPAYMKEYFWAGMKTTQRVESINSFFDGFVNRNTKLHEFPMKYNKAMTKRVSAEHAADARCSKYERQLVTGFNLEKMFQKIYTDTKFQEFQRECSRLMYVYPRGERVLEDNVMEYMLEDRVWIIPEGSKQEQITDRRRLLKVTFNPATKEVKCDCAKFETFGILCKHSIRVLDQNLVFDIPQRYILDRWRKDIVRKHTRVKVSYHDPLDIVEVKRFNKMMSKFESICEDASTVDDPTVELVMQRLAQLSAEIMKAKAALQTTKKPPTLPRSNVPPSEIGSNIALAELTPPSIAKRTPVVTKPCPIVATTNTATIMDPKTRKKPRGRPKSTRYKSWAEMGFKKTQKQKDGTYVEPAPAPPAKKNSEHHAQQSPVIPVQKGKRQRNNGQKKDSNASALQGYNDAADDDLPLKNFLPRTSPSTLKYN